MKKMVRGWLRFLFQTEEDENNFFEKDWSLGPSSLILHHWKIDFNPVQAAISTMNILEIVLRLSCFF
jgi:hypothetical protein